MCRLASNLVDIYPLDPAIMQDMVLRSVAFSSAFLFLRARLLRLLNSSVSGRSAAFASLVN